MLLRSRMGWMDWALMLSLAVDRAVENLNLRQSVGGGESRARQAWESRAREQEPG
jgi:hypothetical protein